MADQRNTRPLPAAPGGRALALRTHIIMYLQVLWAMPAWAAGTVTLHLDSARNGTTVAPGAPIQWTITAALSTGDNFGLALIAVDLRQSEANPQHFDLPPAGGVPAGMEGFVRPAGISNPGPGGAGSAWGGTPVGKPGATDLAQIGGAQNTFGVPFATGAGLDVDVDGGIGQGPGGQIIASGFFNAPPTPGTYTIFLDAGLANTLDHIHAPPMHSPVGAAVVTFGQADLTFTVTGCAADLNRDGMINPADLAQLLGSWGACPGCPSDLNGDGVINAVDLAQLLGSWGPCR